MITVKPLPESYSWKGKRYPKGVTQIPEDLAQALGLATPEKPPDPIAPPSEPAAEQPSEQQAEPESTPEQKTSSRRSKK